MLTSEERKHLDWAYAVSAEYKKRETELIDVIAESDRLKIFAKMNCTSLYQFATEILGLSESISYALIAVARKSREVPQLKKSGLSVSKASRIVAALTKENAGELIEFAKTHTAREIDFEVVKRNPKSRARDRVKPVTEDLVELKLTVPREVYEMLQRVETLEAQKGETGFANAVGAALKNYLFHKDPVAKAQRSSGRVRTSAETKLCTYRVRKPLKASVKHTVFHRDRGRCTQAGCNNDRWVQVHHIQPLSQGGTDEVENLITLCAFHHAQIHQ